MTIIPWEEKAVWTTDGHTRRPAHFGDPPAEWHAMTTQATLLPLHPTGLIVVEGEERVNFLSGLITNQIRRVSAQQAIYGGMLSAQGRFLYDFNILEDNGSFLLLTEAQRADGLLQRLDMYRLRSRVTIKPTSRFLLAIVGPLADAAVQQAFPQLPLSGEAGECHRLDDDTLVWRDPRIAPFGWQILVTATGLSPLWYHLTQHLPVAGFHAWEHYRTLHGLPRAGHELVPEITLPLEAGFLELNGVDFGKGCYVGQETTARTHHRGTLRKRLFLLHSNIPLINAPPQAPIVTADDKEVGQLTTLAPAGTTGLAILRLQEVAEGDPLFCQGSPVTVTKPPWATWSIT